MGRGLSGLLAHALTAGAQHAEVASFQQPYRSLGPQHFTLPSCTVNPAAKRSFA